MPRNRPDDLHRTISDALRAVRTREEQETLLGDDEDADDEGCVGLNNAIHFTTNPHASLPVYKTIHRYVGIPFWSCPRKGVSS